MNKKQYMQPTQKVVELNEQVSVISCSVTGGAGDIGWGVKGQTSFDRVNEMQDLQNQLNNLFE